jgi:hypothetical protein
LEPGKPIHHEVVRLKPRANMPRLCDVEVEYDPGQTSAEAAPKRPKAPGPAQVATDQYRKNWDSIWNRSREKKMLN